MCVYAQKGNLKLHLSASRQDTSLKYTHFLISYIGHPAAPQETNNALVITPCQHTRELLSGKCNEFLPLKSKPTSLYNLCSVPKKSLQQHWSWVHIYPNFSLLLLL